MLKSRVVPVLIIKNRRIVKTVNFANEFFIGDPINIINMFSGLLVDEIVIIDLLASRGETEIDFEYLSLISRESFVPLTYGGGVKDSEQAIRIIQSGFEKVIFGKEAFGNPSELKKSVEILGSQAIVGAVDYIEIKKNEDDVKLVNQYSDESVSSSIKFLVSMGVGELLLTNVTREGTRTGFCPFIEDVLKEISNLPVLINGGCKDYLELSERLNLSSYSFAASSIFIMYSNPENILVSYRDSRDLLPESTPDQLLETFKGLDLGQTGKVLTNISISTKKMCKVCLITEDIPNAKLEDSEICYYCTLHSKLNDDYPNDGLGHSKFVEFVENLKEKGKHKKYDCVLGVSGGADSSYLAHVLHGHGLRILAVHFDNTWNSPVASGNIQRVLSKLEIDLITYVVDNQEYDSLYRAFMLGGTTDIETPTDIGFAATLYKVAKENGIDEIIEGHSFRTEGVAPLGWLYMDGRYIKSVNRQFGTKKLRTYPNLEISKFLYFAIVKKLNRSRPLYWLNYEKEKAKRLLHDEYGWEWYGGHHMENYFTAFYHSYFLPKRYGIDYRTVELSALIRSGFAEKSDSLKVISEGRYADLAILDMVKKRLGFSDEEFENVINSEKKTYKDYKTYKRTFKMLRPVFWILLKMNRVPYSFYKKYCF